MRTVKFLLQGFGFEDSIDYKSSLFGFMSVKVVTTSMLVSIVSGVCHDLFGLNFMFIMAYAVLIGFEWVTGVLASFSKGEKHESKKIGRMLLKIATYSLPIYILNQFQLQVSFPKFFNYELDPFTWLYWVVLLVIIWQLIVSLLENLDQLNVKYAHILLKIINKKFYEQFDIDKSTESSNTN